MYGVSTGPLLLAPYKFSCNLLRSLHPGASSNLYNHGLLVHLKDQLIMASKCICKLARLQSSCLHPNSLQVHLQTHMIAPSKFISELSRLTPSHAPGIVHGYRLQPVQISPEWMYCYIASQMHKCIDT